MTDGHAFLIPELKFGPYTLENVQAIVPAGGATLKVEGSNSRVGSRIRVSVFAD